MYRSYEISFTLIGFIDYYLIDRRQENNANLNQGKVRLDIRKNYLL